MNPRQSLVDRNLVDPDTVWSWLDSYCVALAAQTVEVEAACGRVPIASLAAATDIPPRPSAAVDGYALASTASVGASEYNPLPLSIVESMPVTGSTTALVDSGAPLPEGADAVLCLEQSDVDGERLEVSAPVAAGENVVRAGREAAGGDVIAAAGRRISPRCLGLLMAAGVSRLQVVRRPRVRIVCARRACVDSGSVMVGAMLRASGCDIDGVDHADDDARRFAERLDGANADLVVTIGGTGAGERDFAVQALSSLGEVACHGVAVHPGEQLAVGALGATVVIQLPGLPLPCFIAADLFLSRAVWRLAGLSASPVVKRSATLRRKIASRLGRLDVCRVRLEEDAAHPIAVADATTLSSAVRADGYVLVPLRSEGFDAGEQVTVHLYEPI